MVVVAAIDKSERAESIVEEAEILAEAFDESVHVAHVLTRSDFLDMGRTAEKEAGKSTNVDKVQQAAAKVSQRASDSLSVNSEAVGLVGEPAKAIIEYASEQDARYIIVGSRKRSPTGKAVFGSVAQSVIINGEVSVVATNTDV